MCVGGGTAAIFESVRITGATIVSTNQARVTLSRCTLTDCPVGVLAQGDGSSAALRRCTAHGCAAVAVAAGAASVTLTDVVATMPRPGGVAVDARGAGTRVRADGVDIQVPDCSGPLQPAPRDAGFRGRDGATLELADCTVSQCMGGLDLGDVGTVGEAKGCKVQGSLGDAVAVRGGAAADLQQCVVSATQGRGIVAEGLGSNVHAVECRVQRTTGDTVSATAGAAVRAHVCELSESADGCGAAAAGGGSFLALHGCTLEGHASGIRASEGGIVRAEDTTITRCVTGAGAHAEGTGSALQLEGCHISAAGGDGVAAEGGGMVEGRRMRVRTAGVAGGAVGAGSCVRVTGTGSVVRMHESSLSRGAGGNVLAEMGGDASLQGCEVTAAVAGGGAQAIGCGSRVVLRQCRVHANAGGGVGVADGALVSANGSNIAGGMHASGEGSRLRLHACEVRGVVAATAGVEVKAEECEFEVKPKGSDVAGVKLELTDCRWTRKEVGASEGGAPIHGAAQLDSHRVQPPMAAVSAAISDDARAQPAAVSTGAGAVSAAGDARRHVFRVAEDVSGSGEGSGSVAGGAGPPRVGALPAVYAADAAEAAQAEATLAPSAHARGSAGDRRDSGGSRRRRYIFGPFSGGDRSTGTAPAAGPSRGAPPHGEPFHNPNPIALDVHPDGSSQVDLGAVATSGSRGSSAPAPNVEGTMGAQLPRIMTPENSTGSTAGTHSLVTTSELVSHPPAATSAAVSSEQTGDGSGSSSSRAALRWLRVSGRPRSGQRAAAAGAAVAGTTRTSVPVSVSDAAAAAAAAYVATAARRQASEAAARPADVRPLLLRNPDGHGRGRESAVADSRGGSTDFVDSGAESAGPEERASAVLRVAPSLQGGAVTAGSAGLGTEAGGDGRRRSGLMRALQRVRRGRRQPPGAPEGGGSPRSG